MRVTQAELQQFIKKASWVQSEQNGLSNSVFFSSNSAHFGTWDGQWVVKFPHVDCDDDLAVLTNTVRAEKILRHIDEQSPYYQNVFHVEGYRLKLIFTGSPADETIQSNMIYLYMTVSGLEVAMIDEESVFQRISLNDIPNYTLMQQAFLNLAELKNSTECPIYISHAFVAHANAIFEKLSIPRAALLMPCVANQHVSDRNAIADEMFRIYCKTGNIIVNACVHGTFLTYKDANISKEVLVDATFVYHCDVAESITFFNRIQNVNEHYWSLYNMLNGVEEDPIVAMIKTLFYLESQMKGHAANTLVYPAMIPTLHAFRQNEWALDLVKLKSIKFLLDRSKARKERAPTITPALMQAFIPCWKEFDDKLSLLMQQHTSQSQSASVMSMFKTQNRTHEQVVGQKRPLDPSTYRDVRRENVSGPG